MMRRRASKEKGSPSLPEWPEAREPLVTLTLPASIGESELDDLMLYPAGEVDLRRDLFRFVSHAQEYEIKRTRYGNRIPKASARKLAKILSWAPEAEAIEEHGDGYWSELVSSVAHKLGLVRYDTQGVYSGYSSSEPSFEDNVIRVDDKAFQAWLALTPLEKERKILDGLLEITESEFFHRGTLVGLRPFDRSGSATGPAGRMNLPTIRRGLLELLARLPPGQWYLLSDLVALLRQECPHLILDPGTRGPSRESDRRMWDWESEARRLRWDHKGPKGSTPKLPPKPEVILEDIYVNFSEYPPGERYSRKETQITSDMPDAFSRVEGRYLERFLCEIPYLCGFVSLAVRDEDDPVGLHVDPPMDRLRAVKLSDRLAQVVRGDPELSRITVRCLPTLEVLVHAPSYPDVQLLGLEKVASLASEDERSLLLKLDKKKIIRRAATEPGAPSAQALLESLCADPLPGNVTSELRSWESRGEKVVVYEDMSLLELMGSSKEWDQVLKLLGDLVVDSGMEGMAVVRRPKEVFERLEADLRMPLAVTHRPSSFARVQGKLAPPAATGSRVSGKQGKRKHKERVEKKLSMVLQPCDLMAYRVCDGTDVFGRGTVVTAGKTAAGKTTAGKTTAGKTTAGKTTAGEDPGEALCDALFSALKGKVAGCILVRDQRLLLCPASELPALRKALRGLPEWFEVSIAG